MARLAAIAVCLLAAGGAHAHFYFVLPAAGTDPAKLVLSDAPAVDKSAEVGVPAAFTLAATDAAGQAAPASAAAGGRGFLAVSAPADAAAVTLKDVATFTGVTYAVPTLVVQSARHQKAPGELPAAAEGLAVAARPAPGGVAFAVTLHGKPHATKVTVYAPDAKRPTTVETDAAGLTRPFPGKGLFAARASAVETQPGEHKGNAYKQTRRYATVTTTAE